MEYAFSIHCNILYLYRHSIRSTQALAGNMGFCSRWFDHETFPQPGRTFVFPTVHKSTVIGEKMAVIFYSCAVIWRIAYAWRLDVLMCVLFSGFSSFYCTHLLFLINICLTVLFLVFTVLFCNVGWDCNRRMLVGSFCSWFVQASGCFLFTHAELPTWL